jgi:hypothetical protein
MTFLQRELGRLFKQEVALKINENTSRYISFKKSRRVAFLSLHRIFLKAPQTIMRAIVSYLLKRDVQSHRVLQEYIEAFSPPCASALPLQVHGKTYDLQALYNKVESEYFPQGLKLSITWFGQVAKKKTRQIVFGKYDAKRQLIKIHRRLDSPLFPAYFVEYIIYHEMLHYLIPPKLAASGRWEIHGRAFKQREKEHREFDKVQHWLKTYKRTYLLLQR